MSWQDLAVIAPFALAILLAGLVIVVDAIRPGDRAAVLAVMLVGLGIIAVATVITGQTEQLAFGGAYKVDALTTFLDLLFISIAALTLVFAPDYLVPRSLPLGEF